MQLKNLDKYIKDKVQGYKAPYEEELWKGIEEKLPAGRVPNGIGSWMWPVAAVAAIAILAPFTIKFYNLTERNQEMALKNDANHKSQITIALHSNTNVISPAKPSLAITSMLSSDELKTGQNGSPRHIAGNLRRYSRNHSWINRSNVAETIGTQLQGNQSVAIASTSEMALNKMPENRKMDYISSAIAPIESDANDEINKKSDSRYPDRKNPHPLNNERWENWQSIYYPFWDNPAYTGSEGKLSLTADVLTDNTSEPGSASSQNTTTNLGADGNLPAGFSLGVFRLSDLSKYSLQNTVGLALSKAVLQLGSTSVKVGASGAYIANNLFSPLLNYSDQINPQFGFINPTSEKSIEGTTHAFAVNGGLWVSSPHVMAGFDVTNINQPKLGFSSDASTLPRQWRATFGYRFAINSDFQLMPMMIGTSESGINQANLMLIAVYKDKYMLSVAYQNIDPASGLGNAYVYGAVSIAKKIRVFASYGRDMELMQVGVNESFVHAGLKWQVFR